MSTINIFPNYSWDFTYDEWHRLSRLSDKYEAALRLAFTTMISRGGDSRPIENTLTRLVVQVAESTSAQYGLKFDPISHVWGTLILDLTSKYEEAYEAKDAKEAVGRILPRGISLRERNQRLDLASGMTSTAATALEQQLQKFGSTESGKQRVMVEPALTN